MSKIKIIYWFGKKNLYKFIFNILWKSILINYELCTVLKNSLLYWY